MIPDGYYNVVELDEEAFRPLGAKLRLPPPTGRLQLRPGNVQANNNEIVIAGLWSRDSCKKTSGVKQRAGQTPKVLSRDIRARQDVHGRRATQTSHPSGDLRASCRGQYVGEPPQRSPLHTAEIHPRRERKVRVGGLSDGDIPRLAVQTAGIGASFTAGAHDSRHGRQKFRFRLFECSPTHKRKWVTRVAQGAPGNAPGWL